jgi:hypothetical protein
MTDTPIHEQVKTEWREAIQSGRISGKLEVTAKVLKVLKEINRPQQSIKQLIADLESDSWKS